MNLTLILFAVLIGVFSSLMVAMFVEWMRKPRLSISILPPENVRWIGSNPPTEIFVALNVCVSNDALPFIFRWMQRQSARDCHATLNFLREDRTSFIADPMPGRWAKSVQPVPITGVIQPSKQTIEIHDIARLTAESRIHIPAGEEENLAVVARFPQGTDAYGWTNESFRYAGRHPGFTLPAGRYVVDIIVRSEGVKKQKLLRIENDHTINEFRLAPL